MFKNKESFTWSQIQSSLGISALDNALNNYNASSSNDNNQTINSSDLLSDKIVKPFGLSLDDQIIVVKCTSCSKPILASEFSDHLENCQLFTETPENVSITASSKIKDKCSIVINDNESTTSTTVKPPKSPSSKLPKKKRKTEEEKKSKKNSSPAIKDKSIIDLEKQCGVPLDQGGMCSRSITCKMHSVTAKRAVVGRTQLYDILVQKYNPRLKSAANRKAAKVAAAAAAAAAAQAALNQPTTEDDVKSMLKVVKNYKPMPGVQLDPWRAHHCASIFMWYKMKERMALMNALNSSSKP